jgi:hypothetical protein
LKHQLKLKNVNYVEVEEEEAAIGFHKGMALPNHVHAPTHAQVEDLSQECIAIPPVVMGLEPHVHVLGIVHLVVLSLVLCAIHKVVMELEQRVPTHVLQEAPSVVQPAIFPKALPIHIHATAVAHYQVQHVHSLHLERHNMDVPMVEHKATVYVSYPQGNVCLRAV